MLKKIKNFFKWIADHTGISWILGKLGWQSTGQEEDFTFLDMPGEQSSDQTKCEVRCNALEFVDGKAKLVISAERYEALQAEFKNIREGGTTIDNEFRINLDDKQLYITGRYDSKVIMEDGNVCLFINSVGTLDGKEVYGDNEPEKMKELLDLNDGRYTEVNSNVCKVAANNNTPSPKVTSSEVKQHTPDTDRSIDTNRSIS